MFHGVSNTSNIFLSLCGHDLVTSVLGQGKGSVHWAKLKVMRKKKQTLKVSVYYKVPVLFHKKKINRLMFL